MRTRLGVIAALAITFAALAAPALAGPVPSGGVTRQEIADWLTRKGYNGRVTTNSNGVAIVKASMNGVNFDVYFYSCEGQRCRAVQYAAGWGGAESISYEQINNFIRDYRYLRVYRSGDAIWAEYDVDVSPGGSWEQLDESLSTYDDMLGELKSNLLGL